MRRDRTSRWDARLASFQILLSVVDLAPASDICYLGLMTTLILDGEKDIQVYALTKLKPNISGSVADPRYIIA